MEKEHVKKEEEISKLKVGMEKDLTNVKAGILEHLTHLHRALLLYYIYKGHSCFDLSGNFMFICLFESITVSQS